jgi:hypothetical protein
MDTGAVTLDPAPAAIAEAVPAAITEVCPAALLLVERFVASTPASIRVDGHGDAFAASYWRFLNEPARGLIGGL